MELSEEERTRLHELTSGGQARVRRVKRGQILLAAEQGHGDAAVAAMVGVGTSTVYRTKRRFVEGGVEVALSEGPRVGARRKLTGREETLLVAVACSDPPAGRARWTLELLAGEMVQRTEHRGALARDGTPTLGRAVGQALATQDVVHSVRRYRVRGPDGRRARPVQRTPPTRADRLFASMKPRCNSSARLELLGRRSRESPHGSTMNIDATAPRICSCSSTRIARGGT